MSEYFLKNCRLKVSIKMGQWFFKTGALFQLMLFCIALGMVLDSFELSMSVEADEKDNIYQSNDRH